MWSSLAFQWTDTSGPKVPNLNYRAGLSDLGSPQPVLTLSRNERVGNGIDYLPKAKPKPLCTQGQFFKCRVRKMIHYYLEISNTKGKVLRREVTKQRSLEWWKGYQARQLPFWASLTRSAIGEYWVPWIPRFCWYFVISEGLQKRKLFLLF